MARAGQVAQVAARAGVVAGHLVLAKGQRIFRPAVDRCRVRRAARQRLVEIGGLADDALDRFDVGFRAAKFQLQRRRYLRW